MSKTAAGLAIARLLEHVPVPKLQESATAAEALLTAIEQEHGIDLSTLKGEIAAAREPWQRIHDIATAQELGIHTGSTGD